MWDYVLSRERDPGRWQKTRVYGEPSGFERAQMLDFVRILMGGGAGLVSAAYTLIVGLDIVSGAAVTVSRLGFF